MRLSFLPCFSLIRLLVLAGAEKDIASRGHQDEVANNHKKATKKTSKKMKVLKKNTKVDFHACVWTKHGLEQIPWEDWKLFTKDPSSTSLYIKGFPFPGEPITNDNYVTWKGTVNPDDSFESMLAQGFIVGEEDKMDAMKVYEEYSSVPTLFSDPIILEESFIDYRLQHSADIGGSYMIGEKASKGRLVNPAGRRLREHYYRFPDQCDATPITQEVFIRLMIYDQIEAFFTKTKIGVWQDLFPEVQRRPYNSEEISVAGWYGERFAESHVHQITNGWVYPLGSMQNIDTYMYANGLDPNDASEDPNTPAGLGNLIGRLATEWLSQNDGLMKDMDFVDIEGLQRIADYHPNQEWHHWKPSLSGSSRFQGLRNGIVTQQTFVSPSLGIFSFLYSGDEEFVNLGLLDAVPELDVSEDAYIARADEFFAIQRNMTDYKKAVAELANNKILGSTFLIYAYVPLLKELATEEQYPMLYDEFSVITSGCAEYGATHAVWKHKRKYLSGRPESISKYLYKNNAGFAERNPEAANFKPMISPSGDHPEYPSASAAIYAAFAKAADNWFLDVFGVKEASMKTGKLTFTIPASKFYWTDGPSEDITLEYENLDEWIEELPKSRVYGGVHFMDAGIAGLALGKKVGDACSLMLGKLREGDMTATYTYEGRQKVNPF